MVVDRELCGHERKEDNSEVYIEHIEIGLKMVLNGEYFGKNGRS